jgi:signal transduction histidine kinase
VPPIVRVTGTLKNTASSKLAEIRVEDNGIGFEQENAERIFQPFQRLHGRSEYEGTGLGLAICQKIVERHHGTIEVKSAPGEGTTFTVQLPSKSELSSPTNL